MFKIKQKIVLASRSPRRKELLRALGLRFQVRASSFEEIDTHESPEKVALHNACGKAFEVASLYKDVIVIGVDTVGAIGRHVFGKPKNDADARRILKILSGKTHEVISALCVLDTRTRKKYTAIEKTKVTFAKMSREDISAYVSSGEQKDKAAAFAIQGKGALFIKKIDGDYFNVVGLPIFKLGRILKKISGLK